MLDDPELMAIDPEDLKSFGDLTEIGSGNARFYDCKFCLNGLRILLTNEINFDKEPSAIDIISPQHFWDMMDGTFKHVRNAHKLAIFKRFTTIIGGKHGVYVRICSEDADQRIVRFSGDGPGRFMDQTRE